MNIPSLRMGDIKCYRTSLNAEILDDALQWCHILPLVTYLSGFYKILSFETMKLGSESYVI